MSSGKYSKKGILPSKLFGFFFLLFCFADSDHESIVNSPPKSDRNKSAVSSTANQENAVGIGLSDVYQPIVGRSAVSLKSEASGIYLMLLLFAYLHAVQLISRHSGLLVYNNLQEQLN